MVDPVEVEAARIIATAAAIGPREASFFISSGGGVGFYEPTATLPNLPGLGIEAFVGVDWDEDLDTVVRYAEEHGELDCASMWSIAKQDRRITLVLELEWPDVAVEKSLAFDLDEWSAVVSCALVNGSINLHRVGADGLDKLDQALQAGCEGDGMVETVVLAHAAYEKADAADTGE